MAIVRDFEYLKCELRQSLLSIPDDPSHEILQGFNNTYTQTLQRGWRKNLYKIPEPETVKPPMSAHPSSAMLSSEKEAKKMRRSSFNLGKDFELPTPVLQNVKTRPRAYSSREVLGSHKSSQDMGELKSPSGEDAKKLEISLKHVSKPVAMLTSPLRGEVRERIRSDPNLLLETSEHKVEHKMTASNNTMDSASLHSSLLQSTLDEDEDSPIHSVAENLKDSNANINNTNNQLNSTSFNSSFRKETKKVLPPYIISKIETPQSVLKSGLSLLLQRKAELNNPMAEQYAKFSAKLDAKGISLKIMLPFSKEPSKPLAIMVQPEATVDDVIGFCLFEYINEKIHPVLPTEMLAVANWNLRIVEDDGEIDEDFPALERGRKIQKYAFDQFALLNAKQFEEVKEMATENSSPQVEETPSPSSATHSVLLRIHLYSTLEIKQTTIMQMPTNLTMQEVFNRICSKRNYDQKLYILKMADTKTDVPLDKTLLQLDTIEFCVLKRSSGGAGDIFLRPPDEESVEHERYAFESEDFRTMYKQYMVTTNKLMGKQERVLTLDGEYIHLDSVEAKKFFDRGKSAVSYHFGDVISCLNSKKTSSTFRLTVGRQDGTKIYEFEAASPSVASKRISIDIDEICARFTYILEMRSRNPKK